MHNFSTFSIQLVIDLHFGWWHQAVFADYFYFVWVLSDYFCSFRSWCVVQVCGFEFFGEVGRGYGCAELGVDAVGESFCFLQGEHLCAVFRQAEVAILEVAAWRAPILRVEITIVTGFPFVKNSISTLTANKKPLMEYHRCFTKQALRKYGTILSSLSTCTTSSIVFQLF
jgi:hypothetical protein